MPPPGGIRQIGTQGGVAAWYNSLPPITRYHATASLALMLASSLIVLKTKEGYDYGLDYWLYLNWGKVLRLQIWRPLTCFLYVGGVGLPNFFRLLWLVMYGTQLESGTQFGMSTADYVWMYMFGMLSMLALRLVPLYSYSFFGWPFVMMILYLWSRYNPTGQVSIFGLIKIPGFYLPFAFMAVDAITKPGYLPAGVVQDSLGIVAGHLYYFLREIEPLRSGRNLIHTPLFVKKLVHRLNLGTVPSVREVASSSHPSSTGFRAFRGQGRRLTD